MNANNGSHILCKRILFLCILQKNTRTNHKKITILKIISQNVQFQLLKYIKGEWSIKIFILILSSLKNNFGKNFVTILQIFNPLSFNSNFCTSSLFSTVWNYFLRLTFGLGGNLAKLCNFASFNLHSISIKVI